MIRSPHLRLALALLVSNLGAGIACTGDHSASTGMTGLSATKDAFPSVNRGTLIKCSTNTAQTVTRLVGPFGGALALGATTVVIPANAVLAPTVFTLTVPATKYAEIDVKAAGMAHFFFQAPVVLTIDYSRCDGIDGQALTVWNIDPATKALLERMPSIDNKLTRTITFTTTHFSGYAVADRS